MRDLPFWKTVVVVNAGVPLALLTWDASHGELGANAVTYALHTTGILSLVCLLLSLTATPVRLLTGWTAAIAFRRSLGLFAFFYACLHAAIFVVLDRDMNLRSAIDEVLKRTYLQVGAAAVLLMLPLAVTSTNAMRSWLGAKRWKQLHRLAYVSAALGALHYYLLVKADVRQPLAFAAVLTLLLAVRIGWLYRAPRKGRSLETSQ